MMSPLRDSITARLDIISSIRKTGMSSRSIFQTGCGLAAISGPMFIVELESPPGPAPPWLVSKVSDICLLRSDLQNLIDCLHQRRVVGLGDDPARREEADDDVG